MIELITSEATSTHTTVRTPSPGGGSRVCAPSRRLLVHGDMPTSADATLADACPAAQLARYYWPPLLPRFPARAPPRHGRANPPRLSAVALAVALSRTSRRSGLDPRVRTAVDAHAQPALPPCPRTQTPRRAPSPGRLSRGTAGRHASVRRPTPVRPLHVPVGRARVLPAQTRRGETRRDRDRARSRRTRTRSALLGFPTVRSARVGRAFTRRPGSVLPAHATPAHAGLSRRSPSIACSRSVDSGADARKGMYGG